jgi:hypothetical protein
MAIHAATESGAATIDIAGVRIPCSITIEGVAVDVVVAAVVLALEVRSRAGTVATAIVAMDMAVLGGIIG